MVKRKDAFKRATWAFPEFVGRNYDLVINRSKARVGIMTREP